MSRPPPLLTRASARLATFALVGLPPLACGGATATANVEEPTAAERTASTAPAAPAPAAAPGASHGDGPPGAGEHQHAHHHGHGHHEHGHGHGAGYDMDFSATERFAAHFDDPERDAWQRPAEVVTLLALSAGQVVADLGAGTGYFVPHLSLAVGPTGRVVALDAEPKMVEYLEQRGKAQGWTNVAARGVPYDDPTLAPGSVDRVLIVNTWHHISDREAYSRKLLDGLRPGGAVLVVDFTAESDMGPPPRHRLAPERVVAELEAGGLRAAVVAETLPKQYVVRGSKP